MSSVIHNLMKLSQKQLRKIIEEAVGNKWGYDETAINVTFVFKSSSIDSSKLRNAPVRTSDAMFNFRNEKAAQRDAIKRTLKDALPEIKALVEETVYEVDGQQIQLTAVEIEG